MANLTFQWEGDINVVGGEVKKDGVPISAGSSGAIIEDIKGNYIDNSNFSVNTNGEEEYVYTDTTIYTVDRWYIDGGILTPIENGVQFTNPNTETGSSTLVRLRQNIHYGFSEFTGKTVTLSAKINDTIYSTTATIPTEKPTEGTAVQFITVGIADFSINLNYSVTADYFVPYIAVAYGRTVLIEWIKLEVNGEFSGYIEPDYMTELIKMNFTTSDKGELDIPTGESYDDTEIKEDIEEIRNSIPSTVTVKTGKLTCNSMGEVVYEQFPINAPNYINVAKIDDYMFICSPDNPLIFKTDLNNLDQIQYQCNIQDGSNGFAKIAVFNRNDVYIICGITTNGSFVMGEVLEGVSTIVFNASGSDYVYLSQYGNRVLTMNSAGRLFINIENEIAFEDFGALNVGELGGGVQDFFMLNNNVVAVNTSPTIDYPFGIALFDLNTGSNLLFEDITDAENPQGIYVIYKAAFYKNRTLIFDPMTENFYSFNKGSFEAPFCVDVANKEVRVQLKDCLLSSSTAAMDSGFLGAVGDYLVAADEINVGIYYPTGEYKQIMTNSKTIDAFCTNDYLFIVKSGGNAIRIPFETEEISLEEAFKRL